MRSRCQGRKEVVAIRRRSPSAPSRCWGIWTQFNAIGPLAAITTLGAANHGDQRSYQMPRFLKGAAILTALVGASVLLMPGSSRASLVITVAEDAGAPVTVVNVAGLPTADL